MQSIRYADDLDQQLRRLFKVLICGGFSSDSHKAKLSVAICGENRRSCRIRSSSEEDEQECNELTKKRKASVWSFST